MKPTDLHAIPGPQARSSTKEACALRATALDHKRDACATDPARQPKWHWRPANGRTIPAPHGALTPIEVSSRSSATLSNPARIFRSIILAALLPATSAPADPTPPLDRFKPYQQGASVALLAETRQAVFRDTANPDVRAARERDLLAFLASDAHPQAKALAIEWLGCLGSPASVPVLAKALTDPALAEPAKAALARIPGPAAVSALGAKPPAAPASKPAVATVVAFTTALDADPASRAADARLITALESTDQLLAGAALRRIRAGAGSPDLPASALSHLDRLPPGRAPLVLEALAARPGTAATLHPVLTQLAAAGPPAARAAAIRTLGRILTAAEVPQLLDLTESDDPVLAAVARDAFGRATDPAVDALLVESAGGPDAARALAAIDVLTLRHSAAAVAPLWALARAADPARAPAAVAALGALLPPDRLPQLLEWLVSAAATPLADPGTKALWALLRRHPDPAAAAVSVEQAAATAPPALQDTLRKFAARIRPAPPAAAAPKLALPATDDRAMLAPNGFRELACLDCGSAAEATAAGVTICRTKGSPYTFGAAAHPLATVDFGAEVAYDLTGLDPAAGHVLGLAVWDADLGHRRQSLAVDGETILPAFLPLAWHAGEPTFARLHLPLPPAATADGKVTVTIRCEAGPNAVVSQLWLLRREPQAAGAAPGKRSTPGNDGAGAGGTRPSPAATAGKLPALPAPHKKILILTGDDFPGHRWRETGPEFAAILRADPRLEVTVSESPYLLGSPVLAAYDAVFLHFKNYAERLPTAEPLWRNLESYVRGGGGLVIAHFGCGALQEWQGFVAHAGRIWDPAKRGHDPYGEFLVRISNHSHPTTRGLADFQTRDELYTCLVGDTPVEVLAEATSKVDQSVHPMAFVLTPGKGRVFHCPLGHDTPALKTPGTRSLYLQGTQWAAGL